MFKMSNETYDFLKYLVIIVLPAIGALYTGLSQIWTLPYAPEIPATITCVETFLGSVLLISSAEYNRMNSNK